MADSGQIIETAKWRLEIQMLELELVGIVQHPARFGVDAVDVSSDDGLDAGCEF